MDLYKTQEIIQAAIETTKTPEQETTVARAERDNELRSESIGTGPKSGRPTLDWNAADKYTELRNFRLKVNNVFQIYIT